MCVYVYMYVYAARACIARLSFGSELPASFRLWSLCECHVSIHLGCFVLMPSAQPPYLCPVVGSAWLTRGSHGSSHITTSHPMKSCV